MKDIIHHGKCIKGFIYHLSQHHIPVYYRSYHVMVTINY